MTSIILSGVKQADEICFPLSFKGGGDPEVKPPRCKGRKKGGLCGYRFACLARPTLIAALSPVSPNLGKIPRPALAGSFWRQDRRRPRKRFRRRSLLQKVLRTKRIQACRIARGKEQKSARHPSHQQPPSGLRQCINGRLHGAAAKCLSHCIAWRNPIRLNMRKSVEEQRICLEEIFRYQTASEISCEKIRGRKRIPTLCWFFRYQHFSHAFPSLFIRNDLCRRFFSKMC